MTATAPIQLAPTPGVAVPRRWRRLKRLGGLVLGMTLDAVRQHAVPAVQHLREHAYSIAGFGCIDVAAFVHSTFTGLIVTGLMFLLFEWKVSGDG